MKNVDYIIVGLGLAGLAFARELEKNKKSFIVYENNSQHSSKVAGGMYNPVILKRFTPVWDAEQQLSLALPFYAKLEALLKVEYDIKMDTYRLFASVEEQNNWFAKCDHPLLSKYLEPKIITKQFNGIEAKFGYGKVKTTGRINTGKLLNDYRNYLNEKEILITESFNYDGISFNEDTVSYDSLEATRIVFCEGFGIKKNPFFKYLPLNEAKGELITIHAPELKIDFLLKAAVFILPLGEDLFKIGATFNWKDKTNTPTNAAKEELTNKLKKIIDVPFKIVDQVAGIRPTVIDRRPLVGTNPNKPQLAVLNGLGTRGVMIAPRISKELYEHLENEQSLRKEIDIERFKKDYFCFY